MSLGEIAIASRGFELGTLCPQAYALILTMKYCFNTEKSAEHSYAASLVSVSSSAPASNQDELKREVTAFGDFLTGLLSRVGALSEYTYIKVAVKIRSK